MTDDATPLAVCLLTPDDTLPAWATRAVRRMLAETDAELSLVVADTSSSDRSKSETIRRLVELREWGLVAAAMDLFGNELDQSDRRPVQELPGAEAVDWIQCNPITVDGWKNRLPEAVVDRVGETDVAIRFGFGFLVGEALDAPEMGVLSFHHGDLREYRGQPMGFWEYVQGRETAGVTLQRINETLDGGEIVTSREVDIDDAPTWAAVRRRLLGASEDMLADGIRQLQADDYEPETLAADELGELNSLPKGRPVLTFLGKTARGVLRG